MAYPPPRAAALAPPPPHAGTLVCTQTMVCLLFNRQFFVRHPYPILSVILIYKKKDPQDPRNYRPIYVSTAIYGIFTRLFS